MKGFICDIESLQSVIDKDQPFIWIPEDPLGLSKVLVEELKKAGVSASDLGSTMSEKGVVEVSRGHYRMCFLLDSFLHLISRSSGRGLVWRA